MKRCAAVVPDFADVACAQSPLLARDDRAGNLAAGQQIGGTELHFRSARRILRDGDQRVRRVESYADNVNLGRILHFSWATVDEVREI